MLLSTLLRLLCCPIFIFVFTSYFTRSKGHFQSCILPLFQNESSCEAIVWKCIPPTDSFWRESNLNSHKTYAQGLVLKMAVFLSFNFSDVNECDDNPNYCQVGGQCVNTPGSYRCLCKDGYEVGNGGSHCIGKRHFHSFLYIASLIRIIAERVKKRVLLPKDRFFSWRLQSSFTILIFEKEQKVEDRT